MSKLSLVLLLILGVTLSAALVEEVYTDGTTATDDLAAVTKDDLTRIQRTLARQHTRLEAKLDLILTYCEITATGAGANPTAPTEPPTTAVPKETRMPTPTNPTTPTPAAGGVTYTTWGRTTCPHTASLVYQGKRDVHQIRVNKSYL